MKIMIFDQGHPVTKQLASKAVQVFDKNAEIVIAKISEEHPWNALDMLQKAVDEEQPQVLLIGATTLGEEIAPALGIRLGTGVAAHCIDMFLRHFHDSGFWRSGHRGDYDSGRTAGETCYRFRKA